MPVKTPTSRVIFNFELCNFLAIDDAVTYVVSDVAVNANVTLQKQKSVIV